MLFTLRSRILILVFLSTIFILSLIFSQENEPLQVSHKGKAYSLHPQTYAELPAMPSPYMTEEGMEIVVACTKSKKYTLIPVTVENGEPMDYKQRQWDKIGKGRQLDVDARDFPALARTGLHSEIELDQTKTITGKSIGEVTYLGRPERSSGEGFMSCDEDIISVLKGDNYLVKKLGLTHPQMAKPLFHVWNIIKRHEKKGGSIGGIDYFLYNGRKVYLIGSESGKGWQESIFNDEILGAYHIEIGRDLDQGEKEFLNEKYSNLSAEQMTELLKILSYIHTGEMVPYYIMRYGFYEGHTGYRADPIAIASIFGLKSIEEIEKAFEGVLYKVLTEHFTKENVSSGEQK
jgi:hypothetical protein